MIFIEYFLRSELGMVFNSCCLDCDGTNFNGWLYLDFWSCFWWYLISVRSYWQLVCRLIFLTSKTLKIDYHTSKALNNDCINVLSVPAFSRVMNLCRVHFIPLLKQGSNLQSSSLVSQIFRGQTCYARLVVTFHLGKYACECS